MANKSSSVFTTQFHPHERICQNPGSGEKITYVPKLDEHGDFELVESGKIDLYGEIQSHKDSCDIYVLLKKYEQGDLEALSRVQGTYGDFTQMPRTFAEALNAMIAGENMFNSLPLEVREKFDFSLEKFMMSMDDMPSFLDKLGMNPDERAQKVADVSSGVSAPASEPAPAPAPAE